jgi:peptide deformylase
MTQLKLHLLGSPVLRERCEEVHAIDDGIRKLVDEMYQTMHTAKGVGLAANQVGLTHRIAVVQVADEEPITLINPAIVEREGKVRDEEGCLSIPEIYADVERSQRVVVETTTLEGARERHDVSDYLARAVQHEIDHLDGILFLDRLSPLKRKMLLKKWKKLRKGETGYIKDVMPARSSR